MEQSELRGIGYRRHYYGQDHSSDTKQCFHCKYGKSLETNREKIQCTRWKMVTEEDDICDYFEFSKFWAFDYTEEDRERRQIKLENAKNSSSEGCYIATAVYGGYDQPEVMVLRRFRDGVLKKTLIGRMLIQIYYSISPQLAKRLKKNSWINRAVKNILDKFVEKLQKKEL